MSRRELRALGVIVNPNNTRTMSNANNAVAVANNVGAVANNAGTVEKFSLHPYSENINPSTVEGRKLYLTATTELNKDDKIRISIENGHKVKNHLETCSSKYSWGLLIWNKL